MTVSAKQRLWITVFLLLMVVSLRVDGLSRDALLTADEALFSSYGRQLVLENDYFLYYDTPDKPPTTFFLIGLSVNFIGEHDFSARLPNFFFSLISLSAFLMFARAFMRDRWAYVALLIAVLSPLEINYAPTAFQDPPMMAMLIIALWMSMHQRWFWSALWLAMAIIMKPTGAWMAPLVGLILIFRSFPKLNLRQFIRFGIGFVIPLMSVFLWDVGRETRFYALGAGNNNPRRLIRSDEVLLRLEIWTEHISDLFPSIIIAGFCVIAVYLVMFGYQNLSRFWGRPRPTAAPTTSPAPMSLRATHDLNETLIAQLMIIYCLLYIAVHWLIAFNTFDRYMLIIAPLLWVITALGMAEIGHRWRYMWSVTVVLILISGIPTVLDASQRDMNPQHRGIDQIADRLNERYSDAIIYDYWLNQELRWYLGQDTDVVVVYFSSPEELGMHLQSEIGNRYFIAPTEDQAQFWLKILSFYHVETEPVFIDDRYGYVLYRIRPPLSVLGEFFG